MPSVSWHRVPDTLKQFPHVILLRFFPQPLMLNTEVECLVHYATSDGFISINQKLRGQVIGEAMKYAFCPIHQSG